MEDCGFSENQNKRVNFMSMSSEKKWALIQKIIFAVFWIGFVALCFFYRDEITVERVVTYTPSNRILAAVVMLGLFALKSISFFVYGGILYAASGIIFSLPQAIGVNTLGTFVMTVIPYLIGKKAGRGAVARLTEKNSKLELLREASNRNGFFISFFIRIVGLLPGDLVGMYLGANGISFWKYVAGTMIGLYPAVIAFSVMGMSAEDPSSPAFIISAVVEIGLCLLSILLYILWSRRKKKRAFAHMKTEDGE